MQTALSLVSQGLDPVIQKVLDPHLGGLEWPMALQELDRIKGRTARTYSRNDVQCQLRVITERLGPLGFPFDAADPHRKMSIYGSELRLVRNRWAHNDEFTALEAMRAVDTAYILLTTVGDQERANLAALERSRLLQTLVEDDVTPEIDIDEPEGNTEESLSSEHPTIPQSFKETQERFGARQTVYEPWNVVVTGDVETLENLPKKSAKESVRATVEEIVDSEGPIHINRLTKLVGYTYGLGKVHEARAKKILAQIKASTCITDKDGFVWPDGVDQSRWLIYRTSPAGTSRNFLEISPRELANAASEILRSGPISEVELRRATLETFGRKKASKTLTSHIGKGVNIAILEEMFTVDPVTKLFVLRTHA
ncbi:Swt1 family HEPN domain-containing protein [Paenarthrobacter sp. NPDC058233]|uniref:Swt1 family HEPN domain-containing protein n=1 Tax=Paenarthrobacter sp. NPDC058233 TaxID=3346394 RepID=UPI0036D79751